MIDLNDEPKIPASEVLPPARTAEVIPFGRYKGQPVEALAQDKGYTDWLMAQPWFRERYGNMYTLIVNNFREPSETPEHNALQVLFLDKMFCLRFAEIANPLWLINHLNKNLSEAKNREYYNNGRWERNPERIEKCENLIAKYHSAELYGYHFPRFEIAGADVELFVAAADRPNISQKLSIGERYTESTRIPTERFIANESWFDAVLYRRIEIKPSVSDDYPAILRQMKASNCGVLFTEQYTGYGATMEQFIQIFEASGIKVVFRDQIGM